MSVPLQYLYHLFDNTGMTISAQVTLCPSPAINSFLIQCAAWLLHSALLRDKKAPYFFSTHYFIFTSISSFPSTSSILSFQSPSSLQAPNKPTMSTKTCHTALPLLLLWQPLLLPKAISYPYSI